MNVSAFVWYGRAMMPSLCMCYHGNCALMCLSERELEVQRTCLHPIQELFLWTLHDRRLEMAIVFWERCDVST